MSAMKMTVAVQDGVNVVTLAGEIDVQDADEFRAAMEEVISAGGCPRTVLDVSGIARMNSYAVALIGCFNSRFLQCGGRMIVVGAQGPARRALELSGLDKVLSLAGTAAEAAKMFKS